MSYTDDSGVDSLPPTLNSVSPPKYLSPSKFGDLVTCPLSVVHGLPQEDLLPPHPTALLGSVVHETMERVYSLISAGNSMDTEAVSRLFDVVLERMESRLRAEKSTAALAPLRQSAGWAAFHERLGYLKQWAADVDPTDDHRIETSFREGEGRETSYDGTTRNLSTGSECILRVKTYRLAGRVDLIERDEEEGVIHIVDFKSGRVTETNTGEPKPAYALQVQLYALMAEEIEPGIDVRLWLRGPKKVEVEWNDAVREETIQLLFDTLDSLPIEATLPAVSLARPGSHCRWCRIRYRCEAYRKVAPTWWPETASEEPVAPYDTWGTLTKTREGYDGTVTVSLRDAAGRSVRVSGIDPRFGVQSLATDSRIWFFELEPSERLPLHGSYHHPRNFHIRRPNRAWSDALRCRIFAS